MNKGRGSKPAAAVAKTKPNGKKVASSSTVYAATLSKLRDVADPELMD